MLLLPIAAALLAAGYQLPSKPIVDLVDAPPTPAAMLSPDQRRILFLDKPALPSVAELAQPELRLAGLRIDPRSNGPSRREPASRLTLRDLDGQVDTGVAGLPVGARIPWVLWSPDSKRLALVVLESPSSEEAALRLYLLDEGQRAANAIMRAPLNAAAGTAPCHWLPDSQSLICRTIPARRGPAPKKADAPAGPVVQESMGRKAPAPTFQDLLKSPADEDLLDWALATQLQRVPIGGQSSPIGAPGAHLAALPSPDGSLLLVETLHRPYSYRVPLERFPRREQLWSLTGEVVREVADLPLREEVGIDFDAVPVGPRDYEWRADADASLCWVEARDGGDPKRKAELRDELLCLDSPSAGSARSLAKLPLRYSRVLWSSDSLALVEENFYDTRRARTWAIAPGKPQAPKLVIDRSSEDRYAAPGHPLLEPDARGQWRLRTVDGGRSVFFAGAGASPKGDYPFLDRRDLDSGKIERLWQSAEGFYEVPLALLKDGKTILERRESQTSPPNYFLRRPGAAGSDSLTALTRYPHPAPELKGVRQQLLEYTRKDGVKLSGTLLLPPGYDEKRDGRLPTLLWLYPREFKSAAAAGQVDRSQKLFVRPQGISPLFFLLEGYAVLDNPTMPIVGEGDKEPNDNYVDQLVAGAEAAVQKLVETGVADPERLAVGGHSYGAFTAANLLAHTRLFRAGIARSGAYNRTLTPFGFQSEQRNYWQAPQVYQAMSPFSHAALIKDPLLLIHGEADNNQGTYPMQSERLYDAIKGLGGTVRLVLLPFEAHGYRGRESVLHTLWEMNAWLDKYVKRAQPRTAAATPK